MVYNFTYEIRRPGLIFILCDLSDKMKIVENQLQEAVNSLYATNRALMAIGAKHKINFAHVA